MKVSLTQYMQIVIEHFYRMKIFWKLIFIHTVSIQCHILFRYRYLQLCALHSLCLVSQGGAYCTHYIHARHCISLK